MWNALINLIACLLKHHSWYHNLNYESLASLCHISMRSQRWGIKPLNLKAVFIRTGQPQLLYDASWEINQYSALSEALKARTEGCLRPINSEQTCTSYWEIFPLKEVKYFCCSARWPHTRSSSGEAFQRLRSHREAEEPATTEPSQSWRLIHRWRVTSLDGE